MEQPPVSSVPPGSPKGSAPDGSLPELRAGESAGHDQADALLSRLLRPVATNRNRALGFALRLCIAAGLIVLLVWLVDWAQFRQVFVQYGVRLYLVLIPIAGLGWLVYACRWRLLLQPLGLKPPFRELVADSLVGLFFGLFIPTGLTGDAMRAFRLGRRHDVLRRTFVSVVLDRVVSLVSVMLLFGIQAARSGSTWRGVRLSWAGWAVLAALLMGAALVLVGRDLSDRRPVVRTRRWKMGGWLERWPFSWLLRQVGQLWDIAGEYARARRLVGLSLGVSVVYQLVVTSAYFVGGTMLGIEVAFGDYVWIVAFVMMAQVLPITIAGIGVREGLFAFLLGQYGVPTTTAVALSLVVFSVTLLFGIVGGILGLVSDTGLASGDLAPD